MEEIGMELIKMEKAALDRWGKGDPDGFLEICAPDVVYFDPYREERVDGLKALTALMETIRGQVYLDRFELINPLVQVSGELAILTFNYISFTGEQPLRWNCTEAYRREPDGQWRIIQTHWSYTNVFKYHKS
jgi:ketosteroid isomerase-like protein